MVCNRKAEPAVSEKVISPTSSQVRVPGPNGRRSAGVWVSMAATSTDAVMRISLDLLHRSDETMILQISHHCGAGGCGDAHGSVRREADSFRKPPSRGMATGPDMRAGLGEGGELAEARVWSARGGGADAFDPTR